jgi:hypothetical protein
MDEAKRVEAPIMNRRLQSDRQQKKSRQARGARATLETTIQDTCACRE